MSSCSAKLFVASLMLFWVLNDNLSSAATIKRGSVETAEGEHSLVSDNKLYAASNEEVIRADVEQRSTETEEVSPSVLNDKIPEEEVSTHGVLSTTTTSTTTSAPPKKTSVLILIRDALKKVTNGLPPPTQQVTNALQYFQLFEHFLQQTIEKVIDVVEEDGQEATTVKSGQENSVNPVTKAPETLEVSSQAGVPEEGVHNLPSVTEEEKKEKESTSL